MEIKITTSNITLLSECLNLVHDANKLGPVGGIFNLAAVLDNRLFENQDVKSFEDTLGSKAIASKHLDEISRELCPKLKHFVMFSSVSCGRGNPGQSNYGMANSVMERIAEQRFKQGLPGKAIQWGAIGDVGLLTTDEKNLKIELGGYLAQRIGSCLEVFDDLLSVNEPIVASMVVAGKRSEEITKENVVDTILTILSVRDRKLISLDTSLTYLGMDSLMGVEIQQNLERYYDISLSAQEMTTITLRELEKRVRMKVSNETNEAKSNVEVDQAAALISSNAKPAA